MAKVFVGMSGGVDSSVSAALLKRQGHEVVGITLHLTSGCEENKCCGADAIADARLVCNLLDIPHYTLNRRDLFKEFVTDPFMADYLAGSTPNPCVICNDLLKFGALLEFALANGADYLAMGHYARIVDGQLMRANNRSKDQTYFLYRILNRCDKLLFPLGDYENKDQIRELAEEFGIHVARKQDSQEVCFVKDSYIELFDPNHEQLQFGHALNFEGEVIGSHDGVLRYTLGQRKGVRLHVQTEGKLFVAKKDLESNTLTMGTVDTFLKHDVVLADFIACADWDALDKENLTAVTRYQGAPIPVSDLRPQKDGTLYVGFEVRPEHYPAKGQSVVLYSGDRVVGGGIVTAD